jgi:hypothetical protein
MLCVAACIHRSDRTKRCGRGWSVFHTEEYYEPLDYYREQFEEAYFEPDYETTKTLWHTCRPTDRWLKSSITSGE